MIVFIFFLFFIIEGNSKMESEILLFFSYGNSGTGNSGTGTMY